MCFVTIRNNTALKQYQCEECRNAGFGTIRNNTALKLEDNLYPKRELFWNHSKQHSSKTKRMNQAGSMMFWNHSKQHSSKT